MTPNDSICTLERIAGLLDAPQRERFLSTIARFRNVPPDDEYLQILESIGFMTLIWKSVPAEVLKILEGASPVQETCNSVAMHVREAVNEAIPSHQDLRLIVQSLREHETSLKSAARNTHHQSTVVTSKHPLRIALVALAAGALGILFSQYFTFSIRLRTQDSPPASFRK